MNLIRFEPMAAILWVLKLETKINCTHKILLSSGSVAHAFMIACFLLCSIPFLSTLTSIYILLFVVTG